MKFGKEIKTGIIAIASIGLLIAGVNFLKGNSFLGGDDIYYAYFPNSGGVTAATSIVVDGVPIGKVLNVEWIGGSDSLKRVKMTFNIQEPNFKIPKTSTIEAGGIDLFTKGLILVPGTDLSKGFYPVESSIQGIVSTDITSQVKSYAEPINAKLQAMMTSVDKMVTSLNAFWDTTATSELEESIGEMKIAIKRLGNVAYEVENLVAEEKVKLSKIFSNVQSISSNLEKSNDQITKVLGNVGKITDDLVTADFKATIGQAKTALETFNKTLESANKGEGTLGKLLGDDQLYMELNRTNQRLQNLVEDLQVHPERYIHFSVLGAKTKGASLSPSDERKLRKLLDSIPN